MSGITEDRQIALKRELIQFRESDHSELVYPASFSNLERRFVHRVATELGLVSESAGKGEERFITVKKKVVANVEEAKNNPIPWSLTPTALQALKGVDIQGILNEVQKDVQEYDPNHIRQQRHSAKKVHDLRHQLMQAHRNAEEKRRRHPDYEKMHEMRNLLPAAHHRMAVSKMVDEHQIVLVTGETGCGKSTQVPQFLLESESHGPTSKIVITQPRRISALSLAERIAHERCEPIGESVGYNIRFETKLTPLTQMVFVTPGVLLRKMIVDRDLEEFSHIIVDEAHERDRYTEFLLICLRDMCSRRKNVKLVLMSATMHTDKLRGYFGDIVQVSIGSSIFPVGEYYLEHILSFTQYNAKDTQKMHKGYFCSGCGKGPYLSGEELGAHCAGCYAPPREGAKGGLGGRLKELEERVGQLKRKTRPVKGFDLPLVIGGVEEGQREERVEAVEEGEEEGDDDEDSLSVASITSSPSIVDAGETGEKTLLSEESAELHSLLEAYQASLKGEEKGVDYDLILSLLLYLYSSEYGREGTVLIFLPGWEEISSLSKLLSTHSFFTPFLVLSLHSMVPKKEQERVFSPSKQRKIVLSTNIGETSLTIEGVSVVIDSGLVKEKVYDPHTKLSYLKLSYISAASAKQRKGRAGRTRSGVCFRLYSLLRSKHLSPYQDSEILRMPLEELILQAKSLGVEEAAPFLLKALDPPSVLAIEHGVDLLAALGCIDKKECLTPLGAILVHFPMNPRIGKMLLYSVMFNCLLGGVGVASIMTYKDPFVMPNNELGMNRLIKTRVQYSQNTNSDCLSVYHALNAYQMTLQRYGQGEGRRYCDMNDLSVNAMNQLKSLTSELERSLSDLNIDVHLHKYSTNNGNVFLLSAILSMGLYPYYAVRRQGSKLFTTEKGAKAKIHGSSINSKNPMYKTECKLPAQLIVYQELTEINPHSSMYQIGGANYQMRNTAPLSFFTLLLCAGKVEEMSKGGENVVVQIDNWVHVELSNETYDLITTYREFLKCALVVFVQQLENKNGQAKGDVSKAIEKVVQALEFEQHVAADHVPKAQVQAQGHGEQKMQQKR